MKKKNIFTIAIAAILVVVMAVTFTACGDNKDKKPDTTTESATKETVSTTEKEEIPVIKDETTAKTETTTEEVAETEAPTTQSSGSSSGSSGGSSYTPETTKKPATTSAPQTTKAPETTAKPAPKPTEKPTQAEKVEPENEYVAELPTTPSGAIDFGAMKDQTKEEEGEEIFDTYF